MRKRGGEELESESERMRSRKKQRRKTTVAVLAVFLMLAASVGLAYRGMMSIAEITQSPEGEAPGSYQIRAKIIDEAGRGQISERMREYIGRVEQDFSELGYTVAKITLPAGTTREIFVDIEGVEGYYKISMERDAAVSVEDAARMTNYLQENGIATEYVDVRVEGKAYYFAKVVKEEGEGEKEG